MTKEELAQKIAQGEYTECRRDGEYSISFKIGDYSVSVRDIGSSYLAITCISVRIRENDYNKILKQALKNELEGMKTKEKEITESMSKL